ncbi:MAG TPA: efflux RND transporter periplasmic adaptor subunit, partial [bacterium]|nr:efflux RND transporter periplasmic adaptor subunit [bacterium]
MFRRVHSPARWLLSLVLLSILAACGGKKDTSSYYQTAKVQRANLVAKVTATGTVSALVTVQVGAQVSGRIQELYVDYNSEVKKGQLLATIDPELFKAALANAKANEIAALANLAGARVQARNAKLQNNRNIELHKKGIVAQADLDTSQAQYDAAVAAVQAAGGALAQARAALSQAQLNLSYTKIISPINGVVISRNVDIGQTVAASFQTPTLFLIAEDLRHMQVDTSVAEGDVGHLQAGMKASFTVDAFPGRSFEGTIRQIRNNATTVQNVVTYDAVIDVQNPDFALRPGMTANTTVVVARRDDVLRVPNSALRFKPPQPPQQARAGQGGQAGQAGPGGQATPAGAEQPPSGPGPRQPADRHVVWLLEGGKPRPVPIQTGLSDGTYTEVVSGDLKEGDPVITDY